MELILLISLLFVLMLACSMTASPQGIPARQVFPPPASPTPMICTQNPPGLEVHWLVEAQSKDSEQITLKGFGFIPKEKLVIKIEGSGAQNAVVIGTSDYAVGEDGSFSDTEVLPLDEPVMQWKAYIIHQRGTACFQFETKR